MSKFLKACLGVSLILLIWNNYAPATVNLPYNLRDLLADEIVTEDRTWTGQQTFDNTYHYISDGMIWYSATSGLSEFVAGLSGTSANPITVICLNAQDYPYQEHINVITQRQDALELAGRLYSANRASPKITVMSSFEMVDNDIPTYNGTAVETGSSTYVLHETGSMHIDPFPNSGDDAEHTYVEVSGSWDFSGGHQFELSLYFDDGITYLTKLWFAVSDSSGVTAFTNDEFDDWLYADINDTWQTVTVGKSAFTGCTQQVDWSNIRHFRIHVDSGSNLTDVYFDRLVARQILTIPFIGFRFDDGYDSTWNDAKPVLDRKGYPAIVGPTVSLNSASYASRSWSGTSGFLAEQQGWDVAVHGGQSWASANIGQQALRNYFVKAQRKLLRSGMKKGWRFAIYPNGAAANLDAKTLRLVQQHFLAGFMGGQNGRHGAWNYADHWMNWSCQVYSGSNNTAIKSAIDDVCQHGGILWLVFHDIRAVATGLHCTLAEFQDIVDYVETKGALVVTYSDYYDNIVQGANPQLQPWNTNLTTYFDTGATLYPEDQGTILLDLASGSTPIWLPDLRDQGAIPGGSYPSVGLKFDFINISKTTTPWIIPCVDTPGAGEAWIGGASGYVSLDKIHETMSCISGTTSDGDPSGVSVWLITSERSL